MHRKHQVVRACIATAGVALVVLAFLRGNYLLGLRYGVACAAIVVAILWLLARSRTARGSVAFVRAGFVLACAVPLGYAIAFPASLNSDVQVFIDDQATNRMVRHELAAVFACDPAYRELSVSSVRLKSVIFTVHGSLGTRADLERLRHRIAQECQTVRLGFLRWDVYLRDTREKVSGLDEDLFEDAEPRDAADSR